MTSWRVSRGRFRYTSCGCSATSRSNLTLTPAVFLVTLSHVNAKRKKLALRAERPKFYRRRIFSFPFFVKSTLSCAVGRDRSFFYVTAHLYRQYWTKMVAGIQYREKTIGSFGKKTLHEIMAWACLGSVGGHFSRFKLVPGLESTPMYLHGLMSLHGAQVFRNDVCDSPHRHERRGSPSVLADGALQMHPAAASAFYPNANIFFLRLIS